MGEPNNPPPDPPRLLSLRRGVFVDSILPLPRLLPPAGLVSGWSSPCWEEPRWKPLYFLASRWACPSSIFLDPHLARGERGQKAFAFHRSPTSHSLP